MTSDSQYPNSKRVFVQYRKHLVVVLIFVGLFGFITGEKKESFKYEKNLSDCLVLRSYEVGGMNRTAGRMVTKEVCESDYGTIQNPEMFLKKVFGGTRVDERDFVAEAVSRGVRFFGFGVSAALVAAVVLALRARGDFLEKVTKVKKVLLVKLASAKSKSKSEKISLLNRFRQQRDSGPKTLQRQANRYATATSALAGFLFVLVIIGSVIIGFSPEEKCESFGGGFEYCEKDWFSSILTAIVGFFLSSLIMLSVLTVATYIQWRTSRQETDLN